MFEFIYLLRILAAILITNSHYEAVYPVSVIANGGLLGDVIFFAVSGYCLYPVNHTFPKWYGRRLKRIYPVVWLITLIYCLIGFYQANSVKGLVKLFLYPTYYHFVASIILLYIVFFLVSKLLQKQPTCFDRNFTLVLTVLAVSYAIIYVTVYDRSYYHIDTVREPMIEYLYFFAMMIGLWFRNYKDRYLGKNKVWPWLCALVLFGGYFASKIAFSRGMVSSGLQFVNQVILLLLLVCLFRGFIGLEEKLGRMPQKLHRAVVYVAGFAFEIYLVQYALIPRLNIGPFPLNFLLVSGSILVSAWLLHLLHDWIMGRIDGLLKKPEGTA